MKINKVIVGVALVAAMGAFTANAGISGLTESARKAAAQEAAKQIISGNTGESATDAIKKAAVKGAAEKAVSDITGSSSADSSSDSKLAKDAADICEKAKQGKEAYDKLREKSDSTDSVGKAVKKAGREEAKKAAIRRINAL